MKCCSKKERCLVALPHFSGFSLPEVAAALIILALVSSSVLTVYNRCIASASDSAQRYQAFWVARENMEALLSGDSVAEMAEIGSSDKYPQIQWQTTVEMFYEPITERMWIQAICSAEYTDTAGEAQTVELTHWLTDLTKEDLLKIIEEKQKEKELDEQDPNIDVDPNTLVDPNEPEAEPEVDCDSLPFCERVKCYIEAGTLNLLPIDDVVKYLYGCLD